MLVAYLDESGTHDASRAVCLGGYISSVERWNAFECEWDVMLSRFCVSCLHRVDLETGKGEFRGISEGERRSLLRTAHRIIRKHTMRGYYGAVVKSDFDQVVPGYAKRTWGGAYGWLVQDAVAAFATWLHEGSIDDSVHLVFEKGAAGRRQVEKLLDAAVTHNPQVREVVSGWTFAEKTLPQLQSADLLAYEAYKHMVNRVVGGRLRDVRKSLRDLLRPKRDEGYFWNAERFLKLFAKPEGQFVLHVAREIDTREKGQRR